MEGAHQATANQISIIKSERGNTEVVRDDVGGYSKIQPDEFLRVADSPGDYENGRVSAVSEVGALSDLDNISVRIADVAARLAVFGDRLRDELRSSTFP